jgi:hypothetical protein
MTNGYSINMGCNSELEFIPFILPLGHIFLEIIKEDDCFNECLDALLCEHIFNGMKL